jgi:hypothetical protein
MAVPCVAVEAWYRKRKKEREARENGSVTNWSLSNGAVRCTDKRTGPRSALGLELSSYTPLTSMNLPPLPSSIVDVIESSWANERARRVMVFLGLRACEDLHVRQARLAEHHLHPDPRPRVSSKVAYKKVMFRKIHVQNYRARQFITESYVS